MFPKSILIAILVLALVSLACGFTVNIPVEEIKIGSLQSESISVPVPDDSPASLELNFGAGELNVQPGASGVLIEGTAAYNVADFKPSVDVQGGVVKISTGNMEIRGFPSIRGKDFKNVWDLKLADVPLELVVNAGAYKGDLELGGLSLTQLEVNDGAADVRLEFSQPNKVEMQTLKYTTGASNVKLSGLSNANFTSMTFRSGAGNYTLDFSGSLQRDADVTISSGVSQVTVVVPEGISARVVFRGGLANINASGEWEKSGNEYLLSGSGPVLTITVEMGAGNLTLRTTS
jgi:hypothetical protein